MKKSVVFLVNRINELLLQYPTLVDSLANKDPKMMQLMLQWLQEIEEIFKTYQLPEAAQIAGYRSKLITGNPNDAQYYKKKKNQLNWIGQHMFDIQNLVYEISLPHKNKVIESRALIGQILQAIASTNAIQYQQENNFDFFLQDLWNICLSNQSLVPATIQLKSALSTQDIFQLMAEEIKLEDF